MERIMNQIHPTAIVDKDAIIGDNVIIGPYSIIEKGVVIGDGTEIESSVRLYTGTKIGKNNKIFHGAAMGGLPQDLSFKPNTVSYLETGDNNVFREGVIIHRGSKDGYVTRFGNNNYIMGNVHFAHDCQVGDDNIVVQNTIIAGHCILGNKIFISGLVGLHQFARVGDYAMLAGCSKIVKDVPPYSMIDGNPATIIGQNVIGLKRAGFSADDRNKIKHAYKIIYHSGMNFSKAIETLKAENDPNPHVQNIIKFFEESERGVTDHR
jgi:UDP-N-acetylglucosamine acyltransferase